MLRVLNKTTRALLERVLPRLDEAISACETRDLTLLSRNCIVMERLRDDIARFIEAVPVPTCEHDQPCGCSTGGNS